MTIFGKVVHLKRVHNIPSVTLTPPAPFRQVQEVARKIATVENECKLDIDVDEYVDKFKWELMNVVHSWASVSFRFLNSFFISIPEELPSLSGILDCPIINP